MIAWYVPLLFTSFFLSLLATQQFIRFAQQKGLVDRPNHRSSHVLATPRGGGIVFVSLWLLVLIGHGMWQQAPFSLIVFYGLPTCLLASIGFIDDAYSLSGKVRFFVQGACAVLALWMLGKISTLDFSFLAISSPYFNCMSAFFLILWSINLFNFMDGMDGIATSEALFVLVPGISLLLYIDAIELASILGFLVAGLLGFLYWNRPRAKVFMGDIGSTTLGLVIPLTALYTQIHYEIPIYLWLMLYGVFLFDATITLIRRILHREKWYEAHRKHAYQRLHQAGWTHGKVLRGLFFLNMFILILTLLAYHFRPYAAVFSFSEVALLAILYLRIEKIKPMN